MLAAEKNTNIIISLISIVPIIVTILIFIIQSYREKKIKANKYFDTLYNSTFELREKISNYVGFDWYYEFCMTVIQNPEANESILLYLNNVNNMFYSTIESVITKYHLNRLIPIKLYNRLISLVSYIEYYRQVENNQEKFDNYTKFVAYCAKTKQEKKPRMIIAGASAYPRAIDFARFAEIAKNVGAYLFVDMAHIAGLVAAGVHQNPVPYADVVATTTHKTLRGPRGGVILSRDAEIGKKMNKAVFPGTQGGPLMHVIAAKAVCFQEALQPSFKAYGEKVVENAQALAQGLLKRNLKLVSGGTDNHLMLLDLRDTGVTGKELQIRLDEVYITANKNTVPNEPLSPFITSGLRLGTPAVTTRGFGTAEMDLIAGWIADAVFDFENKADAIRKGVTELCANYPLYR